MKNQPLKILVVEDNPGDVRLLKTYLTAATHLKFEVTHAERLSAALELLARTDFDAILLDLGLPDAQGKDTFSPIHAAALQTPILILTGLEDDLVARDLVQSGAQDYLVKGRVDDYHLPRSISFAIEHKRTENALLESEDKFKYIFDHSVIGKSITLVSGEINVNQAFCEMLGYAPEELQKRKWQEITHPDDLELTQTEINALLSNQRESTRFIKRYLHKNGSIIWAEVGTALRRNADGKPLYFMTSINDITARKQTEDALHKSERLYHDLFENASLAIFQVALDGKVIGVNPEFAHMFGYPSPDEFKALIQNSAEIFADPQRRAEILRLRAENPDLKKFENVYRRRDGSTFIGEMTLNSIVDTNGQVQYLEGFIDDITERKREEAALAASEDRYRLLVDFSPDAIMIHRQGKFVFVNPATLALLGASTPGDLLGKPILEVVHPDYRELVQTRVQQALKKGEKPPLIEEKFIRLDGGTVDVEVAAIPIQYEGRAAVQVVARDITERKQAEESTKRHNEMLLALHNVTLEMGAELRLPVLLENILKYAQKMLDADRGGGIYLYQADENVIQLARGSGINQGREGMIVQMDKGVVGCVIRSSQPLIVDDYTHWEGHSTVLVADPPSTMLGVPLFLKGQVIGVLTLIANSRLRKFSEQELQQAEMFAAQAAVAIQNAQYYQQAQAEIVERKQAEQTLRETSERLAHMLANSPTVIYALKVESGQAIPTWISENIEAVLGFSAEAGLKLEWWPEQIYPQDRPGALAALEHLFDDSYQHEYRFLRKDGQLIWLHDEHRLLRDADHQPWEIIGAWTDITERKQTEEILRESEKRFATIFRANPAAIAITRLDNGQLIDVNKSWQEVTGYGSAEVIGKTPFELNLWVNPEQRKRLVEMLDERGNARGEMQLRRKPGEIRDLLMSAELIELADERYLLTMAQDITERKQAEEKIRQLNAELEQRVDERTRELREAQEKLVRQEKLAVLGQLAGSVGHELRNPLGIINNAIYYLRMMQPQADETLREYLGIIETETRTADKIISDLLDFSRITSADVEPVHVPGLVRGTLERFPAPENVQVTLKLPENLPTIHVDPRQMTQVLGNLVLNACQAMLKGGKLVISARPSKVPSTQPRTSNGQPLVAIAVKDTGVGITPENMQKLFEPLFTTKPKGIGLGLAVSRKLVEANGGRIEVESEPGKGSTFTLWLPVHNVTASDSEAVSDKTARTSR